MQDQLLWERIVACHPDDMDAQFPVSRRLARENGWSHGYAKRVITEYQRFAYLCRLGKGMATPSDEVDQAWHLHLTYTKHYWGPFKTALGRPLHHMPTKGGEVQASLFKDAYEKTLALYQREFGDPPADIWPPADIRFGKAPHFKRVNTQDVWLIPKPKMPAFGLPIFQAARQLPIQAYGLIILFAATLFGARTALAHGSPEGDTLLEKVRNMVLHWALEHTSYFILGVVVIGAIFVAILNRNTGGSSTGCSGCSNGDSGCGSGCGGCGGD